MFVYSDKVVSRLPLFYVFLSGIGFSLQTLIIKVITEKGFKGSFQCVFIRGFVQFFLASYFIYWDKDRLEGKGPFLFGNSNWVRFILFMRALAGFGSIAFAFLAVELIPIGDSTVLIMLSPLLASILSFIFLGESWHWPELCGTLLSLVGAALVAKPPFLFGGLSAQHNASFYQGVGFALIAACSAASAFIFVRILGTTAKMPWSNVCFSQAIGQMVLAVPGLYLSGQHVSWDLSWSIVGLLCAGGVIGAGSQFLMTIGMQREKSAAATAMRMSDVACGFLWQVLFTSDALSLLSLGGAILVTTSILIVVIFKQPPENNSKSMELTQMQSAIHDIQDSFDFDDGFKDSTDEEDEESSFDSVPNVHTKCRIDRQEVHKNQNTSNCSTTFDISALRARLDDVDRLDIDGDYFDDGDMEVGDNKGIYHKNSVNERGNNKASPALSFMAKITGGTRNSNGYATLPQTDL